MLKGDSFVKNESPIEDDEDVPIVKPINNGNLKYINKI